MNRTEAVSLPVNLPAAKLGYLFRDNLSEAGRLICTITAVDEKLRHLSGMDAGNNRGVIKLLGLMQQGCVVSSAGNVCEGG